jgi:lipoate-protein ligase B
LEEALIRALDDFGVKSFRLEGLTGVHTERGKVAAIGVHIARWVTTHGFALNVATDLDFFRLIVPCGIADRGVTSLSRVLGRRVEIDEVRPLFARRFAEVFEREAVERALAGAA